MKRSSSARIVVAALAAFAVGGVAGGTAAVTTVNRHLAAQDITFGDDTEWAGERVDDGLDAYRLQDVIQGHVQAALEPAGFTTYSAVSQAALETMTEADPAGDPALIALRRTALDGELLRAALLSSFAWWLVGWVGIAAGLACAVLAAAAHRVLRPREHQLDLRLSPREAVDLAV